jgi:hypothetical protein
MPPQPQWWDVAVRRDSLRFPNRCPNCLNPGPVSLVRISSEHGRMTGFYVVAYKTQSLTIAIPFCSECAKTRRRCEWSDGARLVTSAVGAMALGVGLSVLLHLPPWAAWVIIIALLALFARLFGQIGAKQRAVRLTRFDDNMVVFQFRHQSYAAEFASVNVSPAISPVPSTGTSTAH